MSVIDNLIYDRTQEDVDYVYTLKNKILSGGVSSLSPEELAEYMAGMKGAYNYTDMNRVGQAVSYLANRLINLQGELDTYRESLGVAPDENYVLPYVASSVSVNPKTDWAMGDTPTQSQVTRYLADLTNLRGIITHPSDTPEVPSTLDHLTFTVANNIEQILLNINNALDELEALYYSKIDRTVPGFRYANLIYSNM